MLRHSTVELLLTEEDIHPQKVYLGFNRACASSVGEILKNHGWASDEFIDPFTGRPAVIGDFEHAFSVEGFDYVRHLATHSLLISPRPTATLIDRYFQSSEVADFRASAAYQAVMEKWYEDVSETRLLTLQWLNLRIEPAGAICIVEPRSHQIVSKCSRAFDQEIVVAQNVFLRDTENMKTMPSVRFTEDLSALEDGTIRILAAFDVLEHQHDPRSFLEEAERVLVPGGYLFLTTRSGAGFDVAILGPESSVKPIEHLNLFSVEGLESLFSEFGLGVIEMSTPGQLDVSAVQRTFDSLSPDEQGEWPPYLRYLFQRQDEHLLAAFQEFLQKSRLSSHVVAIGEKPKRTMR